MTLLGLDFGTSQTRAVCWDPDDDLHTRLVAVPSIALIDETGFVVGESVAHALQDQHKPGVHVRGLKRMLERTPTDLVARVVAGRSGATLHVPGDRLVLCTAGSNCVFVDGCVAALLNQAAARVTADAPDEERVAVLAVPEWFDAAQQSALAEAARRGGLRVLRLINDAAAAALWWAREDDQERTIAVVDIGAGATAVSIVAIDPQGVYLTAAASDRHWGGDELTAALADMAIERQLPRLEATASREKIEAAIESLKPVLAQKGEASASVLLSDEPNGPTVTLELTRSLLDEAYAGIGRALGECAERALDEAEVSPDEIDEVVALGPTARLAPMVERIASVLRARPVTDPRLDASTTLGAAYEAAILSDAAAGPLVLDGQSTGRLTVPDHA